MEKTTEFELPKAWEKLSHKDILDSIRDESVENATIVLEQTASISIVEEVPIMETQQLVDAIPDFSPTLPNDKKYFRIGEVADLVGVEPHVLRYWESEFSGVRPVKAGSGHRVYARKDVETLFYIRHLLHNEKFSIKGAKKKLKERNNPNPVSMSLSVQKNAELLKGLSQGLKDLIRTAKSHPGSF